MFLYSFTYRFVIFTLETFTCVFTASEVSREDLEICTYITKQLRNIFHDKNFYKSLRREFSEKRETEIMKN